MIEFSGSGTLDAGIGTTTPYQNGVFAPVQVLVFETLDETVAINSGGVTFGLGSIGFFGDPQPDGIGTPPGSTYFAALALNFSGNSSAFTMSAVTRGGTLTGGSSSNGTYVYPGTYTAGSTFTTQYQGTITAETLSGGFVFGTVVLTDGSNTSTWTNVTIGGNSTLTSLNCIQFYQEQQAIAKRAFAFAALGYNISNIPTETSLAKQIVLVVESPSSSQVKVDKQISLVVTEPLFYGGLFQSNAIPSSTDLYLEFGATMAWSYSTVLLPDNQNLANNAVIVTTLAMQFIGNSPVVEVGFYDTDDNDIVSSSVTATGLVSEWDGPAYVSTWDVTPWDGSLLGISPWWLYWETPAVFKQASFQASGTSETGFRVGNLYAEYQILGYTQQIQSGQN